MPSFINKEHENNYQTFLSLIPKTKIMVRYKAAAYILALPDLFEKTKKYFTIDKFDLEAALKNKDYSSGFKVMLYLAADLFHGSHYFHIDDAIALLDDRNFKVVIQAILIRRGLKYFD